MTTSTDTTTTTGRRVTSDEVRFLARFLEDACRDWQPPAGPTAWVPDGGDGGDGSGDGSGGDGGDGAGDDDGTDAGSGDGDGSDGDGDGDGDDAADSAAKAENAALKRRLAAEEKARKKAERELARKKDADRAEAGEYKEMYEEGQKEIARLNGVIRDGAFDRAVTAAATGLKFRNPSLATSLLPKSLRETAVDEDGDVDEKLVERELTKLAKAEPYLVQEQKGQRQVTGDKSTRTRDDDRAKDDAFDPRGRLRRAYSGSAAD